MTDHCSDTAALLPGVEVKMRRCEYPVLINPGQVTELTSVTWDEAGVTFGAAATLSDIETELLTAQKRQPGGAAGRPVA